MNFFDHLENACARVKLDAEYKARQERIEARKPPKVRTSAPIAMNLATLHARRLASLEERDRIANLKSRHSYACVKLGETIYLIDGDIKIHQEFKFKSRHSLYRLIERLAEKEIISYDTAFQRRKKLDELQAAREIAIFRMAYEIAGLAYYNDTRENKESGFFFNAKDGQH